MSRFTVTPWRTQADLLQVRQQIYRLDPDSPDLRRHAVDRVIAWKLRGNLPHAVESTALLVDAILHHRLEGSRGVNSGFSVRAVYSAAFARFVTAYCDIGRSRERSLEPSSMLEIARQIEMPPEFVALRHRITHGELPPLQRLVYATDEALRWLWNAYWSRISEPGRMEDTEASSLRVTSEARRILRHYRSTRRDAIRAGKYLHPEQEVLIGETSRTCIALCGGNPERANAFASVLVEERLLSPSKREYVADLDPRVEGFFKLTNARLGSPLEGAHLIWDALLQRLWRDQSLILAAIVRSLLRALSNSSTRPSERDSEREAHCLWLRHIVDNDAWQSILGSSEISHHRKDMMRWCCLYPGYWCQYLGSKLLETGGDSFKADWEDIFHASRLGSSVEKVDESKSEVPVPTLHEAGGQFAAGDCSKAASPSPDNQGDLGGWMRTIKPLHASVGRVR